MNIKKKRKIKPPSGDLLFRYLHFKELVKEAASNPPFRTIHVMSVTKQWYEMHGFICLRMCQVSISFKEDKYGRRDIIGSRKKGN